MVLKVWLTGKKETIFFLKQSTGHQSQLQFYELQLMFLFVLGFCCLQVTMGCHS